MITTSNSSLKRSGTPNQLLGVRLHTMAISGLSRVRTELFQLLVIPFLAHHPEQLHSQAAGHGDFRNLPSAPALRPESRPAVGVAYESRTFQTVEEPLLALP